MKKVWWGIGILVFIFVVLAFVNQAFAFNVPKSTTDVKNTATKMQRDKCHNMAGEFRNNTAYNKANIDSTLKNRGCKVAKVIQGTLDGKQGHLRAAMSRPLSSGIPNNLPGGERTG